MASKKQRGRKRGRKPIFGTRLQKLCITISDEQNEFLKAMKRERGWSLAQCVRVAISVLKQVGGEKQEK